MVGLCRGSHPDVRGTSGHQGAVAPAGTLCSLRLFLLCRLSPLARVFSVVFKPPGAVLPGRGARVWIPPGFALTPALPFLPSAKDDATLSGKRMQSLSLNK